MIKIRMSKAQVERLQKMATERGTDLATTFSALLDEASEARNLPMVAAITEEQARKLQAISRHDNRHVTDTIDALLAEPEAEAEARNVDDDGRPDFPVQVDPEEAIAAAEKSATEADDEPLPAGRAKGKASPLLRDLKDWARTRSARR